MRLLHDWEITSVLSKSEKKPTERKPTTLAVLQQIISSNKDSHSYQKHVFNAIFSTVYHGALRTDDGCKTPTAGHTLQLSNVKIKYSVSAKVKICFKSHKHQHSPTLLYLPATYISCPVCNLKISSLSIKYTRVFIFSPWWFCPN